MKRLAMSLTAIVTLGCVPTQRDVSTVFVNEIPPGYRDWQLISVAREEGELDDIRAILGNDIAVAAYRKGQLPFPDGAIIARIAWSYDASEENNMTFGRSQSFVPSSPETPRTASSSWSGTPRDTRRPGAGDTGTSSTASLPATR